MPEPIVAPYGAWPSPITAELVATAGVRLGELALDGDAIYWLEGRPAEGGRNVLVRGAADGSRRDLTPAPYNVRTRVHEYGGGAFAVHQGIAYFVNFADQLVYRVDEHGGAIEPITAGANARHADFVVDAARGRLIGVQEEDPADGGEPVNSIVAIDLATGESRPLVTGSDFYAAPRLSPNGQRLAWLSWNHPNMPWDGTELWIGELEPDGSVGFRERVAGGPRESIAQPEWSPDGILHFVSDRSGWWNLFRWRSGRAEPLAPMAAEFARPAWVFGLSCYGFASADRIICAYTRAGRWQLAQLDLATRALAPIPTPYRDIGQVRVADGRAVVLGGTPAEAASIASIDLATAEATIVTRASTAAVDPAYLSAPEAIEFPTAGGQAARGFFYPPRNPSATAPAGELPPLLVKSHGGPTSAASSTLSLTIQFWTSRGIAVLDVDYGGSTGYGRAYRERLDGAWGVVDVEDCVNGARFLAGLVPDAPARVDPNRLAISGGSAGGYTTLCALTFHDLFKVGASYYGVSDLEALARDTHKFESRYLDRLVGPYPARRDLYLERSPIHHVDRLACPIVFLQGLEDRVVPPSQAELMVEALRRKGLPVAYVPFEGEQHGFRRAENIRRALEVELSFYAGVFGFTPADPIEPVPIENL